MRGNPSASRLHLAAAAIWTWWLIATLCDLSQSGKGLALAALLIPAAAWGRGRPMWPSRRAESLVLLSSVLLIVNAFCWRRFGLSPRLSFLTAGPILWTAAWMLDALRPRLGALLAAVDRHRLPVASAFLLAFTAWFTLGAWLRIRAMDVEFWDVGSISQAMSNFAHGFGYVKSVPEGAVANRFAQHFEPIFLLLSPAMRTDRGAEILCLLQTLCVALAALFTGLAMERILRRPAAFWVGCLGLCLHPAAGFPLWTDFHGDVFALLPLSVLLWAHASGKPRTFWIAFLAAAACKEYSLLATSGIALMLLWTGRREPAVRRRGALLLGASVVLFLALELWFMPMFRPEDLPSVLAIHLGPYREAGQAATEVFLPRLGRFLAGVFQVSNLSNLCQALLPFSAYLFAGPAALLGASANIAKDMVFGFDIGTHHFTPALPILFAGLALTLRDRLPVERRGGALFQAGVCLLLSGLLWGAGFWGEPGRRRVGAWLASAPAGDKAHRLHAEADPSRPRLVTGALGGVLFRSPALYFLGSPGARAAVENPPPGLEVYLDLWDQPSPCWAPLDRARDDLARFLAANPQGAWTSPQPGILEWSGPDGLAGLERVDSALGLAESMGGFDGMGTLDDTGNLKVIPDPPVPRPVASAAPGQAQALVLFLRGGHPVPVGLKTPGHPWLTFDVRLAEGWRSDAILRLHSAPFAREDLAAVKRWPVAGEWLLDRAGRLSPGRGASASGKPRSR